MSSRTLASSLALSFSVCLPILAQDGAPLKPAANKTFDSTLVRIEVKPNQSTFDAEWTYTNHREFPLMVEAVESSCGCLAAKSTDYQPLAKNQSGTIRATFTPGNHRGVLRKSLHVRFVGYDKPVELVVEAHIPTPVELSTNELDWKSNALDQTRTLDVTSGTGASFQITGLLGIAESQYQIRQESIQPGTHYRLHITPTAQTTSGIQILQIRTDSPDPRDQVMAVFLRNSEPTQASTR